MSDPIKILSVKNLSTSFHKEDQIIKAVDNISFDLYQGQILGLVGESGSGKSVTALSILCLVQSQLASPYQGNIAYSDGEENIDLLNSSEDKLKKIRGGKISMIFQDPVAALNPVYRCGRQIMLAALTHQDISKKEAKKLALEKMHEVGLEDAERIFRSYPHQLSGGQLQRVGLAIALINDPKVLLADEPTTSLDVRLQAKFLQLIQKLKKEQGLSCIFISHDLDLVAEIADQVAVLQLGKIVEFGPVESIFENPKHPYTKGLLACKPPLDFKPDKLPTLSDFLEKEKFQWSFSPNDSFPRQDAALLNFESVDVTYQTKKWFSKNDKNQVNAVQDLSLSIYSGETLGILGESGSGKTTVGKAIVRLIDVNNGDIMFDLKNISNLSSKAFKPYRREIQIVFQDASASLSPRRTIGNLITEPLVLHKLAVGQSEAKEKAIELMHEVGLEASLFNRLPHELSGGQRQRVCIARALAVEPRLLICDEAVSALDVSVQAQVLNLLNSLKRRRKLTILFISHDLSVVKFMSDRIVVMQNGKKVEEGSSEEIYNKPKSHYTRSLIESIPKSRWANNKIFNPQRV